MQDGKSFIVRVYGLMVNPFEELLVAEEFHYNTFMRKFPGGGLQFGEGPVECLRREMMEELQLDVEVGDHLHTTDFFVESAFNSNHQVLAIYFLVHAPQEIYSKFREEYVLPSTNGEERFRWVKVNELGGLEFTFPVDKKAKEIFLKYCNSKKINWTSTEESA